MFLQSTLSVMGIVERDNNSAAHIMRTAVGPFFAPGIPDTAVARFLLPSTAADEEDASREADDGLSRFSDATAGDEAALEIDLLEWWREIALRRASADAANPSARAKVDFTPT